MTNADTGKFQLWRFLLSPRGRISRRAMAIFVIPVLLFPELADLLRPAIVSLPTVALDMFDLIVTLINILTFWPKFVVTVKRLHDVGWRGFVAAVQFLPLLLSPLTFFIIGAATGIGFDANSDGQNSLMAEQDWPIYAAWLVTIALCLIPGTNGVNRYGPPPRGPQTHAADIF